VVVATRGVGTAERGVYSKEAGARRERKSTSKHVLPSPASRAGGGGRDGRRMSGGVGRGYISSGMRSDRGGGAEGHAWRPSARIAAAAAAAGRGSTVLRHARGPRSTTVGLDSSLPEAGPSAVGDGQQARPGGQDRAAQPGQSGEGVGVPGRTVGSCPLPPGLGASGVT
jgi:hypothetical protein